MYRELAKQNLACPLCGGVEFQVLASDDRYGMGVHTVNCVCCGLVMTNPVLTREGMNDFYKHHYRRYYRNVEIPTPQHIKEFGLGERASYTVTYLYNRNFLFRNAKVIDVGCGEGSILKEIKRHNQSINVVGIEPGLGFARFAREYVGCKVYSSLDELGENGKSGFDLIIVNHVLEHVENPVQFLINLVYYLAPIGSIYIDVPDVGAYTSLADLHIAHCYHFSFRTLVAIAHKAGLSVDEIGRHSPPRHPRSIRCVLMLNCSESPLPEAELDDERIFGLIKSINRWAWYYHFRQILLGCLLRGIGKTWRLLKIKN